MVAPTDNSLEKNFYNSSHHSGGIIIDIGTGDGLFVYQCARQNPDKFYIGIDPNVQQLKKISEKIYRKPSKGGAPNALFIQSAVDDLPPELDGVATEVHVHFPWGTLLKSVASGDAQVLGNIRRVCEPQALLEVVLGLDPERDASEIARLELPAMTLDFINNVLAPKYLESGFNMTERGIISGEDWPAIQSSWAKRLRGKTTRPITYWVAVAI